MRSNGPEGGGQDARHKLPGIKLSRRPGRKTGPFCAGAEKCRMRRWRVLSSLLLLIRSAFASTPPQNQPAPQHH
ncbi:hypothetical protein D1I28_16115 [Escherichia coli]|nr:hypothetical protein [Escherichia coli]